jgi:antitoxin (DNA-binding transcriptional repressor) of toxin-antitoxin stability system
MKIIERQNATEPLAAYTAEVGNGPVVITEQGKPVAVLIPIENADLETVALGTNRRFIELIERSRVRVRAEGEISSEQMRRRFR